MNPLFTLQAASVDYGATRVLHPATLSLDAGAFVAIGGPNGAGKTTLLSLLAGLTKPTGGNCRLLGRDVIHWPRRAFAQKVAVVLQSEPLAFPFTAFQVVAMGRMPHLDRYFESPEDERLIEQAIAQTGVAHLRDRDFRTLSGGEKQRVLLASALAQQPEVLLLDEPATHLDLEHQISLHELLAKLRTGGLLVVAITHDLNLALAYADRLILIHQGHIKADGAPTEVLTAARLREVFQVHAEIRTGITGQPWLSYGPVHG